MINLQIAEKNRLKLAMDLLVLALSLYGVSKWSPKNEDISAFKSMMINVTASLQSGLNAVRKNVYEGFENYFLNVHASKENYGLKTKISELENELFIREEMRKENQRLKGLFDYEKENFDSKIVARVISWSSSRMLMGRLGMSSWERVVRKSNACRPDKSSRDTRPRCRLRRDARIPLRP